MKKSLLIKSLLAVSQARAHQVQSAPVSPAAPATPSQPPAWLAPNNMDSEY